MKKKLRFHARSKPEYLDGETMKALLFEWVKMKNDTYIVYMPQIFRKEPGGKLMIISEKKMMKMLENAAEGQKNLILHGDLVSPLPEKEEE